MRHTPTGSLRRWVRGLAALLLALQASAGGSVAIAHSADPLGGAVALESHHGAQCVVLHDAARCPQCQYQATRTLPAHRRVRLALGVTLRIRGPERVRDEPARLRPRATSPRAPPAVS
jgi:hypothetical protein